MAVYPTDGTAPWSTPLKTYIDNTVGGGGSGNVAGDTHAATSKGTPVDADELPIADSAASYALKKVTYANLKTWIKANVSYTFTNVGAFGYCRESLGAYPARPAGTGPVMFIGPDDPTVVTTAGTTAGGGGYVDGLDFWVPSS